MEIIQYNQENIRKYLEELSEIDYKKFSNSLIPNCNNMLGVRIPILKKLAKDIYRNTGLDYVHNSSEKYFEETMLKGLIIDNIISDYPLFVQETLRYIPKITNWSLCDIFCCNAKIVSKNKDKFWSNIEIWCQSQEAYTIRVGVVMILSYYLDNNYIDRIFEIFNNIDNQDYYVKMAVAWAVATACGKCQEKTLRFLKSNNLDKDIQNMAIRKIKESYRISQEIKNQVVMIKK